MQDLKLALLQTALHWEDPTANRSMLEEKIWQVNEQVDVIVLPEMFTTGFTMDAASFAEPMNFHTFKWMQQIASQTQAAVCGSYIVQEAGLFYNRLLWMFPDGTYKIYDKRHLFRMAGEHEIFGAGQKQLVVEWKGWRICPLVCYDLRFPVWSRNVANAYDGLIYVANWPQARVQAWSTLLKARAIENIAYVAGVNRVGVDGMDIPYNGASVNINFKGEVLWEKTDEESTGICVWEAKALLEFREKFPAWKDADQFNIQ
ncbi:MAG: nitrilase/cyanide hydratase and apolipoprotein n-acyltransferase [Cytophagaceae bacterium]|jgi:predicted amidohydrolase|nr:nitrilase/cyanide hydratase and apolipoprotein n-acyltransferase [Cytophagaceae bacterium]